MLVSMNNSSENDKILTMKNLNPHVIDVQYAVRGPIVIRAAEIEKLIKTVLREFFSFKIIFSSFLKFCISEG